MRQAVKNITIHHNITNVINTQNITMNYDKKAQTSTEDNSGGASNSGVPAVENGDIIIDIGANNAKNDN